MRSFRESTVNFSRDEEEEQEVGGQNEQTRQEEAQEDGEGLDDVATTDQKKNPRASSKGIKKCRQAFTVA